MKIRRISDNSAKKEISSYIIKQKKKGVSRINALEIYDNVRLPPKQIDKVMTKFEKEGRVTEV